MSIPKIIHYCWFGGNEMSDHAKKCIDGWKERCPDYEIMEWNEGNCDLDCCPYVREAYDAGKWAFVTDVIRLHVLVEHGGIYLDTDVELLKPLDDILDYEAVAGFESQKKVMTALMACEKGNDLFRELLHGYDNVHFLQEDGTLDMTANVERVTGFCIKRGLCLNDEMQTVSSLTIFPKEYFSPRDYDRDGYTITERTYAIHHFDGSWLSEEEREALAIKRRWSRFAPRKIAAVAGRFLAAKKHRGGRAAAKEIAARLAAYFR